MNMTKYKKWVAWFAVLALAITLPAAALADADTTAPTVSLYAPTGTQAAATANQKIIFAANEKITLVSGKNITVSDGTATYIADAASGTVVGDALSDAWYAVYDLTDFTNGATALTLTTGANYTVNADAGAFADVAATPNASAAVSGSFATTATSGQLALVFTLAASGESVSAGGSPAVSGQAIASGTTVTFSVPSQPNYTVNTLVKVGGAAGSFTSGSAVTGDLEVYITRTQVTALSGTPKISGNAYYGGTLSADLSGINEPDLNQVVLKWVRVDGTTETPSTPGGKDTTYALTEADIGKTIRLDVTDATLTGTLSATVTITKAPNSTIAAKPVQLTVGETSIVLTSVTGYEYMRKDGAWQDSTTFSGLSANTSYDFFQRVKATTTTEASATSDVTTIKTSATGLTGTATITGTAQFGQTLTGALSGSNASGTITYSWQRDGAAVSTGTTYLLGSADVGKAITLVVSTSDQTGSLSAATAAVTKANNTTAPAAPTSASATATTITLNAVTGYQYSLGGTYWQDTTTFHNLVAGATYTFYQRVAETATTLASAASAGANLSTLPALSGTINVTGEARYGLTMTASLAGSNNTGTLTYTWKRGNTVAGSGTYYVVGAADIGNQLSLEVTSSVQGGMVSRSFGTVAKAYYVGDAPDAPTRASRTTSKIVLKAVDGCEYSRGGTTWQDSTTFSGLKSGSSYTFYQRYKATATSEASPASEGYKTSTNSSSSDGGSSDNNNNNTSSTPSPKPGTTDNSATTALFTYTLTPDNTRILYSTMKSLAEGNKTQDVTIKQDDVEFTFPKGTMTQSYTQLWYDFGATINNSIAVQTAQELAGDAYVAAVHYNYSGELPGKANIRLNVGAAQAGKTLYYYLLNDDKTLAFQQTATVDTTGWATVSQTHCSDYIFLSRDINSASASPSISPSPDAAASPLPSPTASPSANSGGIGTDGWFIAAIILIAVALIVGGIWLYTKNREDRMDDEDDQF